MLERNGTTLVIKRVPAPLHKLWGEEYVDEETATHLLGAAEAAAGAGVQMHI